MKNKSNRFFVSLTGAVLALGAWSLSQNVDVAGTQEALAVADNGAISVACTDPTAASFVPDIAYTMIWSAPAAGSAATATTTAALTGAVNSDSNPTVTSTLNATGAGTGTVLMTNTSPMTKMAGLQCQTSAGTAKVEVNGDGSDNTSFDIAISNLADSDTAYTSADKVDAVAAASKTVLFGAIGFQIALAGIADGSDSDSANNGEIGIGSGNESTGGTESHMVIDVTNYNVTAGTDVETLTLTHTGS